MTLAYELSKPMKGEEIADKVLFEFIKATESETIEYTYTGFFKMEKKTGKRFWLEYKKNVNYRAGDAGPKEVIGQLDITFGEYDYHHGSAHQHKYLKFKIENNETVTKIVLDCYRGGTANGFSIIGSSYDDDYNKYGLDSLVKKTTGIIHNAIYGDPKESTKGLEGSEKIL